MIDCKDCILNSVLMPDMRCDFDCFEVEDALRERDKQIKAGVIDEYKYIVELFREMFLEELERQAVDREEIFMYRNICSMVWSKYLEVLKEQNNELGL